MSLSLVGDYGGSDSSSEESVEGEEEEEPKEEESNRPDNKVYLPSAADLFDSVDAGSASFMTIPSASETPLITPKRKETADGVNASGSAKKSKPSASGGKEPSTSSHGGADPRTSRGFIPPQMSRPNIVTEDSAMWSSDATLKRQRQLEAERRRGGDGEGSGAGGKKGKDLTFKQREKIKRDKGQSSRGKSYVEEEKRLLRELGSS